MTGRSAAAGDPFYERLVGCWRLLRWESIGEDGSVELPMGEVPEGLLAYTPDGTMVTNIGRGGRPPISAGDLLEGPADERLAAFATYIAYAARVALEGETVIHEVPEGLLAYTPDGTMVTNIGRSGRPPISAGDLLEGPPDERLAAFATYIAYAARVALEGETVIHEVVMSLYPNWVGSRQRRHARLSDGDRTLVLTADPFPMRGRVSTQRLTWAKVG